MDRLERERMFVAVVEGGSFAAAARRLGVSSGHASKLVAGLEAELGVQLLARTTRALSLTEVGRAYHGGLMGLLAEFDELHAAVRTVSAMPSGRVRLTAPQSFGRLRLLPLLLEFAQRFPAIRLEVDFSDHLRNLVAEGYDAALRVGHPADSSLMARKVCEVGIALVAAPSYLARCGVPGRPHDLGAHACIVDTNFLDIGGWHFRYPGTREAFEVPVTGAMLLNDGEACVAAAEAGVGIARVPDFVAHDGLMANRLCRLLPEWEEQPFDVQAIYPPARHLAARVRVLIDFLVAGLGKAADAPSR
jgi:DNA-binding transcriptional LysR family regulator